MQCMVRYLHCIAAQSSHPIRIYHTITIGFYLPSSPLPFLLLLSSCSQLASHPLPPLYLHYLIGHVHPILSRNVLCTALAFYSTSTIPPELVMHACIKTQADSFLSQPNQTKPMKGKHKQATGSSDSPSPYPSSAQPFPSR